MKTNTDIPLEEVKEEHAPPLPIDPLKSERGPLFTPVFSRPLGFIRADVFAAAPASITLLGRLEAVKIAADGASSFKKNPILSYFYKQT